jgi:hypothetical protein
MLGMVYFDFQGKEAANEILAKVENKKHNVVKVKKERSEALALLYFRTRLWSAELCRI